MRVQFRDEMAVRFHSLFLRIGFLCPKMATGALLNQSGAKCERDFDIVVVFAALQR